MTDIPRKRMSAFKVILILIGIFIGIPALLLGLMLAISPLFAANNKARFEKLDQYSTTLYEELGGSAAGWTYDPYCQQEQTGVVGAPSFICKTNIVNESVITNVSELNALHDKYFPIIDASAWLKESSGLSKTISNEFGVLFNYSSAEKNYGISGDSDTACTYLALLSPVSNEDESQYGIPITDGGGVFRMSLECGGIASGAWIGDRITY
jgi:hypothetical protein